ncbi:MAG: hypothetical protein JW895_01025 [Thermoleophilaceae bacterium]|nr:hypothetical protein [Thermoleophilaceae bacterium]
MVHGLSSRPPYRAGATYTRGARPCAGSPRASTLPRVPRVRRSITLHRPALRACVPAAVLLALPASLALAKPAFETGPYYGNVALKSKPVVQFTATRKRVKQFEVDPQQVTCPDGAKGALNLPGTPAKRSLKVIRGRFGLTVKASGADPEYAGTKLTGRLKGRKATGTIRIVYRKPSATAAQGVRCDTGKRRWTAQLDEIVVELPR